MRAEHPNFYAEQRYLRRKTAIKALNDTALEVIVWHFGCSRMGVSPDRLRESLLKSAEAMLDAELTPE